MEVFHEKSKNEMGCRLAEFPIMPGRFHWHDKIEICRILSGELKIHIDDEVFNVREGDVIVISEYAIHRFVVEKANVTMLLCQFPVKILLNSGVLVNSVKPHITAYELENDPDLKNEIDTLLHLLKKEKWVQHATNNPFMQSVSAALYFAIMRKYATDGNQAVSKKDRQEFYRIAEHINEYYAEDINVNSIAKDLGFSRGRLSEIFSKFAGTGINTYINTIRINKVNQLLENGVSITDAAFESGFQSMRTFNNVYRKIMNMTPSEYIKRK